MLVATWRAIELYGRAVDPDLRVNGRHLKLTFAESDRKGWSWNSTDLCNFFGGRYTIDGKGVFETRPALSTLVACIPGSRVGERNIAAIEDADQVWIAAGDTGNPAQLTLTADGEPIAVYVRR